MQIVYMAINPMKGDKLEKFKIIKFDWISCVYIVFMCVNVLFLYVIE